jgi:hypothetical protein
VDRDGINWREHFQRLTEKAKKVLNFFRSVGFNQNGFRERTKLMIFKTFLRPLWEYGAAIAPNTKYIQNHVEKTQLEALRAMFSVGRSTSGDAMRFLAGITHTSHRWMELNARWLDKVIQRGNDYMTTLARARSNHKHAKSKSCFATIGRNEILDHHYRKLEAELANATQDSVHGHRPRELTKSIIEKRFEILENIKLSCKRTRLMATDPLCKPRYIYSLTRDLDCKTVRYGILWSLGRFVGKPRRCYGCGLSDQSTDHFIECARAGETDRLVASMRWGMARMELDKIHRIMLPSVSQVSAN